MKRNNYGNCRQTSWERVFLYFPVLIDDKIYWWRWVKRRVVIDYDYEGRLQAFFEWSLIK